MNHAKRIEGGVAGAGIQAVRSNLHSLLSGYRTFRNRESFVLKG